MKFLNSIFAMKIIIAILSAILAIALLLGIHQSLTLPELRMTNRDLANQIVFYGIIFIFAIVALLMPAIHQYDKLIQSDLLEMEELETE